MKVYIYESIIQDYYLEQVEIKLIAANNKIEAYNVLSKMDNEKSYEDMLAYYDSPEYREAGKPKREYFKSDIKYQNRLAKWEATIDENIAHAKQCFIEVAENMFKLADFEVDGEPRVIYKFD